MVILAKSLFLPVNIIIEPVAESTLKVAVFLRLLSSIMICHPAQQVSGQAPAIQENSL